MSLRASALLLWCAWFVASAGGCGGNADEIPIPEAGSGGEGGSGGDVDAAVNPDGDEPDPDAEPEEDAPPAPPSACPVITLVRVTDAPEHSGQPALLWNGSSYVVVWADERNGGSDIYGTMLTPQGGRMPGYPDILIADTPRRATSPEIVALPTAGQGYLVAYETCDGPSRDECTMGAVETVALGADGRPTGTPTVISPAVAEQRRPYLATGHGNVYVTYRDRATATGSAPRTVARLARLNATGALVEPVVTFDEMSDGHYPHVAVSPDRVALVYQRNKPLPEIVLALLDPQLALQKDLIVRPGFDADATNPIVQWNLQRWVIAWEDAREGDEEAIYATVATGDGSQVEPPQRAYDENGNWPTIASGMATSLIGFYGYPGRRIFLARLEATGRLKPGQVVIDDTESAFPAVAYNDKAGEYGVVYQNERLDEVMFVTFKCAD